MSFGCHDAAGLTCQSALCTLCACCAGAELLSLHSEDENKVFGVAFRAPITNSHGTPHVLEHSVLSGTERFPVKASCELKRGSAVACHRDSYGSDH